MKTTRNPRQEQPDIMTKRQAGDLLSALLATAAVILLVIGLFSGHLQSQREYLAAGVAMIVVLVLSYRIRKAR